MPKKVSAKPASQKVPTVNKNTPLEIKRIIESPAIPAIDENAPLEIEKVIEAPEIPTIDKNAPLKIDEAKEKEESEPQDKTNKKLFILGGIVLGIVMAATIALFIFYSTQLKKTKIEKVTVEVSPTPVVVQKQTLIKSDWSFEVLNGSGVAGVAKEVADRLEALGYKVVEIGNADDQDYEGNELLVKEDMSETLDLVIADLESAIKITTVSGILKDSTASARIILGKE